MKALIAWLREEYIIGRIMCADTLQTWPYESREEFWLTFWLESLIAHPAMNYMFNRDRDRL